MRTHPDRRRGNMALETALFLPFILLLIVGMVQLGKITYVYYTLQKTMYTLAMYLSTQQAVNFCDDGDALVTAAKNYALTGNTDDSGSSFLPALTPDMISVQAERVDPASGSLTSCDCSATGCDLAAGGGAPDFIVVSIPDGYTVQLRIPYMMIDPILLRPEVRIPYGGT